MRYVILIVLMFYFPLTSLATPSSTYCLGPRENQLLGYINQYRWDNGLAPLTPSKTLGGAARHHSKDMAIHGYFGHYLEGEGIGWSQNMTNHGYPTGTSRGENIAAGSDDPYRIFDAWRNSPPHNDLMLGPVWRAVGIGRYEYESSPYRDYWTMNTGNIVDQRAYPC